MFEPTDEYLELSDKRSSLSGAGAPFFQTVPEDEVLLAEPAEPVPD